MLESKALLLAKLEAIPGSDVRPTLAANAILCSPPTIEILGEAKERTVVLPYHGKLPPINVGTGIKISFSVEIRGAGALPDTPPRIGCLIQACNYTETLDHTGGSEKTTYTPNSTETAVNTTVTIYFYRDGLFHRLVGCVGNFKITGKANEPGKIDFEMTGKYAPTNISPPVFTGAGLNDMVRGGTFSGAVTRNFRIQIDGTGTPDTFKWSKDGGANWDASTVAITGASQALTEGVTITFGATTGHTSANYWNFTAMVGPVVDVSFPTPTFGDAGIPAIFKSAAFQVDAYSAVIENISIDAGNVISKKISANQDPATYLYYISGRQIKGECDPEVVALSIFNPWTTWDASTPGQITGQFGTVSQNRMKFTLPSCVKDAPKYGAREGSLTYGIPFSAHPTISAGNNELSLVFD